MADDGGRDGSAPALQIEVATGPSLVSCTVHGTVEWRSVRHVADALRVALALGDGGRVLLDLSGVAGVQAPIRRAIHDLAQDLTRAGGARLVEVG